MSEFISAKTSEQSNSTYSTPSTISPAPDMNSEDYAKVNNFNNDYDRIDDDKTLEYSR